MTKPHNKNYKPCTLCDKLQGSPDFLFSMSPYLKVFKGPFSERWPGAVMCVCSEHLHEQSEIHATKLRETMFTLLCIERAIKKVTDCDGINFVKFGNVEPHLHWHIIPRYTHEKHRTKNPWEILEVERHNPESRILTETQNGTQTGIQSKAQHGIQTGIQTGTQSTKNKGHKTNEHNRDNRHNESDENNPKDENDTAHIIHNPTSIYKEIEQKTILFSKKSHSFYFGAAMIFRHKNESKRKDFFNQKLIDIIQAARQDPKNWECLLMKRNYLDYAWDHVGGNNNSGEIPKITMEREVQEELGWQCKESIEVCREWKRGFLKGFMFAVMPSNELWYEDNPPRVPCREVQTVKYFGLLDLIHDDIFTQSVKGRMRAFLDGQSDFHIY